MKRNKTHLIHLKLCISLYSNGHRETFYTSTELEAQIQLWAPVQALSQIPKQTKTLISLSSL